MVYQTQLLNPKIESVTSWFPMDLKPFIHSFLTVSEDPMEKVFFVLPIHISWKQEIETNLLGPCYWCGPKTEPSVSPSPPTRTPPQICWIRICLVTRSPWSACTWTFEHPKLRIDDLIVLLAFWPSPPESCKEGTAGSGKQQGENYSDCNHSWNHWSSVCIVLENFLLLTGNSQASNGLPEPPACFDPNQLISLG